MRKLKFEKIHYIRDERHILNDISLEIHDGENWAILGLNGSGKSTLLSLINAYNVPSSGTLEVLGKTFGKSLWSNVKKSVGYYSSTLEKFHEVLMSQTVENVVLSGRFSSIGCYEKIKLRDIQMIEKVLAQFDLIALRKHSFKFLSQGEKRKTLVARAMIKEHPLLILDEPCANLDIRAREYLLKGIESTLKKENTTLIFVTHNTEEILPLITHVCILKDGKIVQQGLKDKILTNKIMSMSYDCPIEIKKEDDRYYTIVR